eukprot:Phypoly_transcript_14594.p1 GENE.Phypoly_transcript_14594~~Phypoly_transcript_14594.p1  ORF type:complete len:231 (+),score=53.61 Phypoly_transcript_14594:76-768(+)
MATITENPAQAPGITEAPQTEPTPPGVPDVKTTETSARYLAYLGRIRPAIVASSRYLAFTSDVGEAFRPVAHPFLVRGAYAVSWAYCIADVAFEGYKETKRGGTTQDIAQVVAKRSVFQATASMLLPALTIHSVVKVASNMFRRIGRFQRIGPTAAGLLMIPALPFMFDHPVEHLLDYVWPEAHHHPNALIEGQIQADPSHPSPSPSSPSSPTSAHSHPPAPKQEKPKQA